MIALRKMILSKQISRLCAVRILLKYRELTELKYCNCIFSKRSGELDQ